MDLDIERGHVVGQTTCLDVNRDAVHDGFLLTPMANLHDPGGCYRGERSRGGRMSASVVDLTDEYQARNPTAWARTFGWALIPPGCGHRDLRVAKVDGNPAGWSRACVHGRGRDDVAIDRTGRRGGRRNRRRACACGEDHGQDHDGYRGK